MINDTFKISQEMTDHLIDVVGRRSYSFGKKKGRI